MGGSLPVGSGRQASSRWLRPQRWCAGCPRQSRPGLLRPWDAAAWMEPPPRLVRVRVVGPDGSRVVSDESLELELLTAHSSGDRDAEFTAFMAASMPALHRSAFLLCGDAHRADELTQHALERTYRAWSRAREGDPLAYARRVLMNLRVDGWRRTRREVLVLSL